MKVQTSNLPTHIAHVGRRINFCNEDDLATCFLETSYLAEVTLKTIALVLQSGLQKSAREIAYRYAHEFVRADGLGTWERAIREIAAAPTANYLPPEFVPLLGWINKKRGKQEDQPFQAIIEGLRSVLTLLGADGQAAPKAATVKDLLSSLVQIRNKTKAHGAVGDEFYSQANRLYLAAVVQLLECPAFRWRWVHLSKRDSGKTRAIFLHGFEPSHQKQAEASLREFENSGIHFTPEASLRDYDCSVLLRTNRECSSFLLPNGGMNTKGAAEFIDYASGSIERITVPEFLAPPVGRPASETEGLQKFDVQSNVFGNLPELSSNYIRRDRLESDLKFLLLDKNHHIITLHGGGGMGKTSLALCVAHELAGLQSPPFDHIVWFSGRDVDLKPSGPMEVRQSVIDLSSISKRFGELFEMYNVGSDTDALADALETTEGVSDKGSLFIFDNFETMSEVRGLHKFLDRHTHLPNKVLITSRERAFVADYPIEVKGMEFSEATEMLLAAARDLFIEGLMTPDVIQKIYDFTSGHAYVMRVVAGEMAKEGRYIPPNQLLGRREDIVNAVFERSFNKLSEAGRTVFLLIANWRSEVPELGLIVVLGVRGIDAEAGIEECIRLSLILEDELASGERSFSVPQLARAFGQKKLQGDSDRLVIQEDLGILRKFTLSTFSPNDRDPKRRLVAQFVQSCRTDAESDPETIAKSERLLEALANLWPGAWVDLAEFRARNDRPTETIAYAYRRAVEEQPYLKDVWLKRAEFSERIGDESARIASLVSAVEVSPTDVELVREVAIQLCNYLNAHLTDIPKARRGVYLASVRSHMENLASQLDANGLSRLAWLFLLEGNVERANHYANEGCVKDPANTHCIKILERLAGEIGSR